MKDLWERFKGWWCGNDIFDVYLEQMRRQERDLERHRALAEQAAEIDAKQARAELRDRFAIEIVGSLILRMPAENQITPAMCKTVWDIADAMLTARDGEGMK